MDTINAIDLLKEEMQTDEPHLKVNAIHRLKTVSMAISREDYRNQLVPYLDQLIDKECDEVNFSIAAELGKPEVVEAGGIDAIIPLLEKLGKSDETVVRDEAASSLNNLIEHCLSDNDVQTMIVPLIDRLVKLNGRVTACKLFASCYNKSGSHKEQLRKKFLELCNEDAPMTRRAGSSQLGKFACVVEKQFVINEILPIFRRLAQDENDTIRVICIKSLIPLADYLTKEENQVNTLGAILAAGEDKNWKVRLTFAENFAKLAQAFGNEITDANLVQAFSKFLSDQENEVKEAAMFSLKNSLAFISTEKITSYLLPTIQNLYEDSTSTFKANLALALCEMPKFVGKELTINKLMGILLDLIKDDDGDVKLNCANGILTIAETVGTDLLSDSVLSSLSQLTKDNQWRVRESVFRLLANLGVKFGKQLFQESLSTIFFAFLTDTAAEVRQICIDNVVSLTESFGSDWAVQVVIPKLNEIFNQEKQGYLYRMSVIRTAIALCKPFNKALITQHLIPILERAAKDDIPNVKISLCKQIPKIAQNNPDGKSACGALKDQLNNLKHDSDIDVKFFAGEALNAL